MEKSNCFAYDTLNKGLEIRNKKRQKKAQKRANIKSDQVNLVRFVDYSIKIIEHINGKYRHPTRTEAGQGLQVQNRIYTLDGHYKMVNRTTLKITKSYTVIPTWANAYLSSKYNESQHAD